MGGKRREKVNSLNFGELSGIDEIKEMNSDRFAECPIGKSVEQKEFNLPELDYDNPFVSKTEGRSLDEGKAKEISSVETNNMENPEKETRDLTDDEKQDFKERLGWPECLLKKCTIDEDGVLHLRTDRCDLEGKTAENGVRYERKRIEINGVQIEGVFPVFDSAFDVQLPEDKYKSNTYAKECNAELKKAVEQNPELKKIFTPEQLKDIENGRTPEGYVWHHNEEPGKMQLVKREDHDRTIGGAAHTGENVLWGPDSGDRSGEGEDL